MMTTDTPIRGGRGARANAFTQQRKADIVRLFAEGKKTDQVAAALGVDRRAVWHYCRRHGIPIPHWATSGKVGHTKDSIRIVTGAIDALMGAAQGLQLVNGRGIEIERELARQLLAEARNALRPINALVAALKEAAK